MDTTDTDFQIIEERQDDNIGTVLLAEGYTPGKGALVFLGKISGSFKVLAQNAHRRFEYRASVKPPTGWKMAFALPRGFELGFGDPASGEEASVSLIEFGVELRGVPGSDPTVLINVGIKDLKSERKWYAACGYDVLWFGETSGSSVS